MIAGEPDRPPRQRALGARRKQRTLRNGGKTGRLPHGYELISQLLLSACERIGPEGCAAIRGAGEEAGRACARADADTADQALGSLQALGVTCRVNGHRVDARFPALEKCHQASPEVASCLLAGLLQGALDGAGLELKIEAEGSDQQSFQLQQF